MSENLVVAIASILVAVITKLVAIYGPSPRPKKTDNETLLDLAMEELEERTRELEECQEQLAQRS